MPAIIRAEQAHDFLALVPILVGYRPVRSLVWVAFRGNRTAGVVRFDLPERASDREAVIAAAIGMLCRIAGVDAVVPVGYSDAPYLGRAGRATRALLDLAVRRAREAGFLVRDALRVGSDAWGSVLDPGDDGRGRPLSLIESSEAPAAAGGCGPVTAGPAARARLPRVAPAEAEAVARALEVLTPRREDGDAPSCAAGGSRGELLDRLGALGDPVELVEAFADGRRRTTRTTEATAWLVHLAERPRYRDAMMLQVAFGRDIGELALGDVLDVDPEGPPSDGAAASAAGARLADLLLGRSATRPDLDRVERGIDALLHAAASAPPASRAGACCMAGWLSWTLGRGSAAAELLERALDADPEHSMARMLLEHLGTGAFPDWAFAAPHGAAGSVPHERPDRLRDE